MTPNDKDREAADDILRKLATDRLVHDGKDIDPEVQASLASSIAQALADQRQAIAERVMEAREELADVQHQIWSHWMNHFLDKVDVRDLEDFARWSRQRDTDYADLSEKEKDSDRSQADKVLAVLRTALGAKDSTPEGDK